MKKPVKPANTRGIQPFTEYPSEHASVGRGAHETKRLEASELFSHFTANIIKEEKIFTR